MDANLKRELGNMVEVMLFQSGCTQTKRCDPQNPDLNGYIVSHEKLERLVQMVVEECASKVSDTNLEDVDGGDSAVLYAARNQMVEHFTKEFA
jgi:hypothetical protein